jgi:hypothetical protein
LPHAAPATRFGRLHVPEPPSSLTRMHFAAAGPAELKPVSHPPRIPVLDQENLYAQGIDTSRLVPGAPRLDALGSCVANASTTALSAGLTLAQLDGMLPPGASRLGANAAEDERFAVVLYHHLTDMTGDPSAEWPPADCGSSGLYACQFLQHQGLIRGHKVAHGAVNILSLMQTGGLIVGQPWFNSWMNPASDGFIDGDGSETALQEAIASGVAGGHETYWMGVESVGYNLAGGIDPALTVIRFRQSWGGSWGLDGDGLAHLSTFVALGAYCDFRQLTF